MGPVIGIGVGQKHDPTAACAAVTARTFMAMGVDIGQKRDPTAIAVVEIKLRKDPDPQGSERETAHFFGRLLERLPLGTPYPDVARRVREVCTRIAERTGVAPKVFIDATGVGGPVVDLIADKLPSSRSLWAVYFTYGDRRTEHKAERRVALGKAFLVSRLQTLLQTGRIHLPRNPESGVLVEELLDYEIRVDKNANDQYGAFRVGKHDDLVTALGLAVQKEPRVGSVYPSAPGRQPLAIYNF